MTAANIVTFIRILCIPIFMYLAENNQTKILAMIVFALISLTDMLDGYLARSRNEITALGKLLDPLADKLLVTAALLQFVSDGRLAVWAAMVIISREFIISSLRVMVGAKGTVMAAGWSGKIKTTIQMFGVLYLLSPWTTEKIIPIIGAVMALVTLISGIDYLYKSRDILKDGLKTKR